MKDFNSEEVLAVPITIGQRVLDCKEITKFEEEQFSTNIETLPNRFFPFEGRPGRNFKQILEKVREYSKHVLIEYRNKPLAFFYILNLEASNEAKWLLELQKKITKFKENVYSYLVIWDERLNLLNFYTGVDQKRFNLYLFSTGHTPFLTFNPDAPTIGAKRVIEFMRRVLGYDLPSRTFPDYPMTVIRTLGEHINLEDFNLYTPKREAIPKYPIIREHPYFPTLAIGASCPHCGREVIVPRSKVDSQGNAEVPCKEEGCSQLVMIKNIGWMFDPWPEYDTLLTA